VPTDTEWNIADAFADPSNGNDGWDNNTETFDSALKLPSAGYRTRVIGVLINQGTHGYYWSSTVSGTNARYLYFTSSAAYTNFSSRVHGFTVRCLKD